MGDLFSKVAQVVAPEVRQQQQPFVGMNEALNAENPNAGPNVTQMVGQMGPQPYTVGSPIDRWLPIMQAAGAALSTPSAGGAGPIMGNALTSYVGGREQSLGMQAAAAKAQRDQAIKMQAIQATEGLRRAQLDQTGAYRQASLGHQDRALDERISHDVATESKSPGGKTTEEKQEGVDRSALNQAIGDVGKVYNARQKSGTLPRDPATGLEIGPEEFFDSKEGQATLKNYYLKRGGGLGYWGKINSQPGGYGQETSPSPVQGPTGPTGPKPPQAPPGPQSTVPPTPKGTPTATPTPWGAQGAPAAAGAPPTRTPTPSPVPTAPQPPIHAQDAKEQWVQQAEAHFDEMHALGYPVMESEVIASLGPERARAFFAARAGQGPQRIAPPAITQ